MDELEPTSDETLADRARLGESGALAELWRRHARAGLAAARQFSAIADPDDIVSEAYVRIMRSLQHGGGPHEAFRPYLYTTIRNVALDWRQRSQSLPLDVANELADPAPDPEIAAIESTITHRAFRNLPERWRAVLWYTEVEGMEPAEAAPLLGLSPNAAAALAYRAREGLKSTWLQAHVNDFRVPPQCRWATKRMSDYARGTLSPQARVKFEGHVEGCTRCTIVLAELEHLQGRLAVILLPAVLGGGAAASLIAERVGTTVGAVQAAAFTTPTLAATTAGGASLVTIGVLGGLALTAALVITPAVLPGSDGTQATGDAPRTGSSSPTEPELAAPPVSTPAPPSNQSPPATPDPPSADAPPSPPDAAPTSPPAAPPVPPAPPVPVDTVAPLAPAVLSPASGTLLADAFPTFSGTGEPASTVVLQPVDAAGLPAGSSFSTVVAPDGSWSATAPIELPEGANDFEIVQRDAAGNPSPPVPFTLRVDTVALPPSMAVMPSGEQLLLPVLDGVAEPLSQVVLHDATGALLASTTAAPDGAWSLPVPDPMSSSAQFSIVQTDAAGNRSAPLDLGVLTFARAAFTNLTDGQLVPSTGGSTVVDVEFAGIPGMLVEAIVDGVPTGNIHELGESPIHRDTRPLADGPHTVGLRYYDPATGSVGATITIALVISAP